MVKFLPFAVVISTILFLACDAVQNNLASDDDDDSPKDSPELVSPSASSNSPSSGRVIRPSAWSKEEKGDLEPKSDKKIKYTEQDILLDTEKSSFLNMEKLFRYVATFLHVVNQNSDDSLDKSTDDRKIKTQDVRNNNPENKLKHKEKAEMQTSGITDIHNESSDDGEMQNLSNNDSLKNKEPTKNSKIKMQTPTDKDSADKSKNSKKTETRSHANTHTQNKSSDEREMQNQSNVHSLRNRQPIKSPKKQTQNSIDKDSIDKSENNIKTESNDQESNDQLKSATNEEMQSSATNDPSTKPSDDEKMQRISNNDSEKKRLKTDNSKNRQQNSMNKGHLKKSTKNVEMQNDDTQVKLISVSKDNEQKEDMTKHPLKDYEDGEITLDKNTANSFPVEETNKYEKDNDNEEEDEDNASVTDNDNDNEEEEEDDANVTGNDNEDEDDANENDADEIETEDDYINESNYNNKNDVNDNDGIDNKIKENANDQGQRLGNVNQTSHAAVLADEIPYDNLTTLPKFMIQATRDQQNFSKSLPSNNQINSNDNVISDATASHSEKNKEKIPLELQLSGGEFIDDYINNPQKKNSERENEQSSSNKALIPNGNGGTSKIIPIIPISRNKSEEGNRSLNNIPFVNENMKDQNMAFDQSLKTGNNIRLENNIPPLPIFNADGRDTNPNQGFPDENSPQDNENASPASHKPVISFQGGNEATSLTLLPFEQIPHYPDLQYPFLFPQEGYNDFREPTKLIIQNNKPSIERFQNDAPTTKANKSGITNPLQTYPDNIIPFQNKDYLNDQYTNHNFQVGKNFDITAQENQQFVQSAALQQDIFSNIQNIPNQETANAADKMTYFTNYEPEIPMNVLNIDKVTPNGKSSSNSDGLQNYFPFNQMHNQDSSTTHIEKNIDKLLPQAQLNAMKQQKQIHNIHNPQSQSNNLPFQNSFSDQQIASPQSDTDKSMPQSEVVNNGMLAHKNKTNSKLLPNQNEFQNMEFSLSQNNISNVKEQPPFNITENNVKNNNPKNGAYLPVVAKNISTKPQTKSASNKPLNHETQKRVIFDEIRKQQKAASDFNNNDDVDESSSYDYDNEDYEDDDLSDEYDTDEYKDDYGEENNDDDDYDEDDYNDDDYDDDGGDDYDYDGSKGSNTLFASQSSQPAFIPDEKIHNIRTTSPKVMVQGTADQQSDSEAQPRTFPTNNNDNAMPKSVKSQTIDNKENSFPKFKLMNGEIIDDSINNRPGKNSNKENEPKNLSHETINDDTLQKFPSRGVNDATKSPKILKTQSEVLPSNQQGNFDTILEYIYKSSNNPLFKGLKEQTD